MQSSTGAVIIFCCNNFFNDKNALVTDKMIHFFEVTSFLTKQANKVQDCISSLWRSTWTSIHVFCVSCRARYPPYTEKKLSMLNWAMGTNPEGSRCTILWALTVSDRLHNFVKDISTSHGSWSIFYLYSVFRTIFILYVSLLKEQDSDVAIFCQLLFKKLLLLLLSTCQIVLMNKMQLYFCFQIFLVIFDKMF